MSSQDKTATFGEAMAALKQGKMATRRGCKWFIFQQVPSEISIDIVPKMTSLPEAVKAVFVRRGANLRYQNQIAMVAENNVIEGWTAQAADVLAEDWIISH